MNVFTAHPEIQQQVADVIRVAGLKTNVEFHQDSYGDDDVEGYIELDGYYIFPQLVQPPSISNSAPKQIGWGVDAMTIIPGCRDYPDVSDVETLKAPFVEQKTLTHTFTRPVCLIDSLVFVALKIYENHINAQLQAEYESKAQEASDKEWEEEDRKIEEEKDRKNGLYGPEYSGEAF